jgi:8-oxo-dGTP pyrophosphatase MutT (NUDIX family)
MSEKTERRLWTVKSEREVYDNPWITLTEYQTLAPTGAPAVYGKVHFKNLAIGVLPIDHEGCTILVGQERFCFGEYSWELPEGGGKRDMDPLESARRELSEEAGLKAASWMPLLADARLSNSVTDEKAYAYLAWDLLPDQTYAKDPSEDLAVRRVPFQEALAMAVSGEITDAFSLVMLLKADHLLRAGALPGSLLRLLQGRI